MSIIQSAIERAKLMPTAQEAAEEAHRVDAVIETGAITTTPALVRWPKRDRQVIPIDMDYLRAVSLCASSGGSRRQQDDYRAIRREVIGATLRRPRPDREPRGPIAVVTSALPGDGKSFTSLNLALSIASEGVHDVLLIDADTVKHTITNAFGLLEAPGLIEILENPASDFTASVVHTSNDRLHLLPAGHRNEGATDLFSAGRILPFFNHLEALFRGHVVIIDTPPILLSPETPVMADAAGQVLLVVHAGHTLQDSFKDAASRISQSVPVGVVLNAWDPLLPSEKKAYRGYAEYGRESS